MIVFCDHAYIKYSIKQWNKLCSVVSFWKSVTRQCHVPRPVMCDKRELKLLINEGGIGVY